MIKAKLKTELEVSDKIKLRLVTRSDSEALFDLVNNNRSSLRQWLPWLDFVNSSSDQEAYADFSMRKFKENGAITALILHNEEIAGVIGFNSINWTHKSGSIGYWLGEAHRGKGLVVQSCKRLMQHAFEDLKLHRVEIRCATKNYASRKTPEKLGLKLEGTLRDAEFLYDHYVDLNVYSMLVHEWN